MNSLASNAFFRLKDRVRRALHKNQYLRYFSIRAMISPSRGVQQTLKILTIDTHTTWKHKHATSILIRVLILNHPSSLLFLLPSHPHFILPISLPFLPHSFILLPPPLLILHLRYSPPFSKECKAMCMLSIIALKQSRSLPQIQASQANLGTRQRQTFIIYTIKRGQGGGRKRKRRQEGDGG